MSELRTGYDVDERGVAVLRLQRRRFGERISDRRAWGQLQVNDAVAEDHLLVIFSGLAGVLLAGHQHDGDAQLLRQPVGQLQRVRHAVVE